MHLFDCSWLALFLTVFISGHFTVACVSLYLHREQTHQALVFSPWVSVPMRVWLWISTGMVTKEWVACHRKHHAYVDREGDPHSPVLQGLFLVLFFGVSLYRKAFKDPSILKEFGKGTPEDWLEKKILTPYHKWGIFILLGLDILFLGLISGGLVWGLQMTWVPFWGAGVVNGVGHKFGYRNFETKDYSKNVVPVGVWLSGEELHNNHHYQPSNPKFSAKWFEFDMGWLYIKLFQNLGLANLSKPSQEKLTLAASLN
ncbi:MAG: fatty acid desaturase [Chlamydiae bacterium]|nr:fatty acid desaturase [Chlamydiota bacterium]MBI3278078.1 fatty acid desaturase [Chlamydiota bacterium]